MSRKKHKGFCYLCGEYDTHRSEEHTSELQSRLHLVCRLLLEKKNHSHFSSSSAACLSSSTPRAPPLSSIYPPSASRPPPSFRPLLPSPLHSSSAPARNATLPN